MKPRKMNLGCGHTVDPYFCDGTWINADRDPKILAKRIPGALLHDFTRPFPLADGSLDEVFCEHVLEHFDMRASAMIAREMRRLLATGGVWRIAVPDAVLRRDAPPEVFPDRHGHLTAWTHDSLRWLLGNAGFDPMTIRCWESEGTLYERGGGLDMYGYGQLKRPKSLIISGIADGE